jgi:hypothetical protein
VKRFWLNCFALSIGLVGFRYTEAQYPFSTSNLGPSSYPFPSSPMELPTVPSGAYSAPSSTANRAGQNGPEQISGQLSGQMVTHGNQQFLAQGTSYAPVPLVPPPGHADPAVQHRFIEASAPTTAGQSHGPTHENHGGQYTLVHHGSTHYHQAPSVGWADSPTPQPGSFFFGRSHLPGGHLRGRHHHGGGEYCGPECNDQEMGGYFKPRFNVGGVPASPWFFGGGVLIFQRVDDFSRVLSVDDDGVTMLTTADARNRTMAGFEVMGGRYFNNGRNALAVSYWGLFPETQAHSVFEGGNGLNSAIFRSWDGIDPWTGDFQLDQTGTGTGDPTTDNDIGMLYGAASGHRIRRNSQFHNVEINLLGFAAGGAARNFNRAGGGSLFPGHGCGAHDPCRYGTGPCCYTPPTCGSRLNMSWLAGIRYLQIQDDLEFAALGVPGLGAQTLMYQVCTTNHLVGLQVGGRADYCIGNRANLYALARSGVYNNSASLCTSLGTETASAYQSNSPESVYDFSRRTDRLAFLGEIGTGMGWAFSQRWTATVGYRAVFASGVATSVGNLRYPGQTIDQTGINAKDTLVLHGVNIGALYNF